MALADDRLLPGSCFDKGIAVSTQEREKRDHSCLGYWYQQEYPKGMNTQRA
jgi:hypothetical protein